MIRVLLVEDHATLLHAMTAVIDATDGMTVVAQHTRADDSMRDETAVDVAVIDLDLPGGTGVDVIAHLRGRPEPPVCMVLTGLTDERELGLAVEAGAAAVLHKSTPMPELLDVLRTVATGGSALRAEETSSWLSALARDRDRRWRGRLLAEQITGREREVLEHLVWGMSNDDIAARLRISPDTVQTHIRNLMGKLGASSRLEAVSLALQLELVEPP